MFYYFNPAFNTFTHISSGKIPGAAKSSLRYTVEGKRVSHLVYDLKVRSSRWQDVWCSVIKGCNTSKQEQHAVIFPPTFLSDLNSLCQAVHQSSGKTSQPHKIFFEPPIMVLMFGSLKT